MTKECARTGDCNVVGCEKCDADPAICEQCSTEFWLDKDLNQCIDATCLVENCDNCSILGPSKCDSCNIGFFSKDETTCADCDSDPASVICEQCADGNTC